MYQYLFKFIVIGDSYVGKSCLVQQFVKDRTPEEFESTVGIEFGVKDLNVSNTQVRLSIWDTAGQESFRSLIRAYYRSAICVLLCFDCSNMQSFTNLERWIEEVKENGNENVVIALVCNKIDLPNRLVTSIQARQFAADHNYLYAEVSAIKNINVQQLFRDITQDLINKINKGIIDKNVVQYCIILKAQGIVASKTDLSPKKQIVTLEQEDVPKEKNKKKCC